MLKRFSIIIPIYNLEEHLHKCLDSIVHQTYKNIEIICINDGSTDNSLQILEAYSKKDNRIKIINQENSGVSIARNKGILYAKGDYILFVDGDDYIELNTCEELLKKLDTKNYDLIYFNHYAVSSKTKRKISLIKEKQKEYTVDYFITNASMWSCCYNLKFIVENKISFPLNIKVSEDQIFKITALLKNPSIGILNEYLYNYFYTRENSATKDYSKGIFENIKGFNFIKNTELYKNSSEEIKLLIIDNWAKLIFGMWSSIPYKQLTQQIEHQLKEFILNYKSFDIQNYKEKLVGYKRLRNKWFIRFMKNIRDFFFSIIYRINNNAK